MTEETDDERLEHVRRTGLIQTKDEETDDERLEHVRRTGLIRDAKDLEVWVCQPPFKHDEEASIQSLRALLDAAASFD